MTHLKIYKVVMVILAAILISRSCSKILDQEPKNYTYLGKFWKNASDCNSALAGDYALLRAALSFQADRYSMYAAGVPGT